MPDDQLEHLDERDRIAAERKTYTATSPITECSKPNSETRYQHAAQVGAKRAMLKATISELSPLANDLSGDAASLAHASSSGTLNLHAIARLERGRASIRQTASHIDQVLFRVAVEAESLAADVSELADCQCHNSPPSRRPGTN